jgi:hypothetical protein
VPFSLSAFEKNLNDGENGETEKNWKNLVPESMPHG